MTNPERDQNHLKTYTSFLFEAQQEVHSINHSLNDTKLHCDYCLTHLTRPIIIKEKTNLFLVEWIVKHGVIHQIFNFSFGESDDYLQLFTLVTIDKMKQKLIFTRESIDSTGANRKTIWIIEFN